MGDTDAGAADGHLGLRRQRESGTGVVIALDGDDRRDARQLVEHRLRGDVTGMQDQVDSGQGGITPSGRLGSASPTCVSDTTPTR